jgi:excisionase family DNA binding protein
MSLISNDYLTAKELADAKGVTLRTVYAWLANKEAPASVFFGGRHWFDKKAVEKFKPPIRGPKRDKPKVTR